MKRKVVLLLFLCCLGFTGVLSWVTEHHSRSPFSSVSTLGRDRFSSLNPDLLRSKTTQLGVFGWLGGSKEEPGQEDHSDEVVSANLAGVAGIMDSMSNFKASQRVGDRSGTMLKELSNIMVEGTSTDGKVKVTYNGQQKPMAVVVDESYFQSLSRRTGADDLNVALTEAMQDAYDKSTTKMEDKMKSLYSDLGFDASYQ